MFLWGNIRNAGNNVQIQKISHKAFVASQKKLIFDKQSLYGSQDSVTLQKPALVEANSYPKFSSDGSASIDAGQGSENALMIPHDGDLHEKSSVSTSFVRQIRKNQASPFVLFLNKRGSQHLFLYDSLQDYLTPN